MPAEEKPFAFIMQRIKFLEQDGICPISALQADYQELPQPMQDKLQQLSQMEIDVFVELLKEAKQQGALQATNDLEALAILLISSTKGALQYKRVVGEAFFLKMLEQLKELLK